MNKRGFTKLWDEVVEGPIAVFLIIVAIGLIVLLVSFILNNNKCTNEVEWKALKQALSEADSSSFTTSQTPFVNADCLLVSFSPRQFVDIYPDSKIKIDKPMLCLCKIDNNQCKPFECYKFDSYDTISDAMTNSQFYTANYQDYLFIQLTKSGKDLIIRKYGETKPEITLSYKPAADSTSLDPTNLLKSIKLTLNDPSIISFLPVVSVQAEKPFTPAQVPKSGKFPLLFTLKLASTKKGANPSDIASGIIQIPATKVTEASIQLNLKKDIYDSTSKKLFLYYQNPQQNWESSPLDCMEGENSIMVCTANLKGFSDNFAISVQKEAQPNA